MAAFAARVSAWPLASLPPPEPYSIDRQHLPTPSPPSLLRRISRFPHAIIFTTFFSLFLWVRSYSCSGFEVSWMGSMVMGQTLVRAYPFSQLYALKPFKTLQTRSHEAHQQQQQQRNYHQVHGRNWFLQAKYNYGGFKLIRIIQSKPPDQQAKEAPKEVRYQIVYIYSIGVCLSLFSDDCWLYFSFISIL